MKNYLDELDIKSLLAHALKEDIGAKDITTELFIPARTVVKAHIVAKQDCVICGLGVAHQIVRLKDRKILFRQLVRDGRKVKKGTRIALLSGNARSILTCERVLLNFLSFLSGISTKTRAYVDSVKPYTAKVLDTRKTIPCMRLLEKYAVRIGGGYNHRIRLDDMVMLKDNHLKIAGFKEVLVKSRKRNIRAHKLEIEVGNLREFKEALAAKPDFIMLDNMSIAHMKQAVALRNRFSHSYKPRLEASGGITLATIHRVAATGVELISVGALTHSLNSVDLSLEIL